MRFYINRTGNAEGPHDEATIIGMIQRGEFSQGHICQEGGQAWASLDSHPPFANALSGGGAQVAGAAHQVAAGFGQAANAFGQAAQQGFGQPPAGPQPQAQGFAPQQQGFTPQPHAQQQAFQPQAQIVSTPGAAAPGQGFFEQARAAGPPTEAAKAAAGQASLFAGAGAFVACWVCGLGGPIGAVVGNLLYKETPKHPFALFHINQLLVFEGVIWAAQVVTYAISFVVSLLLVFIATATELYFITYFSHIFSLVHLVLFVAAVAMPLINMGKAKAGEWNELPLVGKRVMGLESPILK